MTLGDPNLTPNRPSPVRARKDTEDDPVHLLGAQGDARSKTLPSRHQAGQYLPGEGQGYELGLGLG